MGAIIIGAILVFLGISDFKGNLSSIHRYHRHRLREEDKKPFGKAVGFGSILCGSSILIFGGLSILAEHTNKDIFLQIGSIIVLIGLAVGLAISLYAIIKYNKGLF